MALDERKARILRAVIEEHIETGIPVGSRIIARRYSLGVSSATIRNEMADLEETGYLDKPHTSSGRVPSDKGYRFYVDELMPRRGLTREEHAAIESVFRSKVMDVVSVLKEAVRVVSETTCYLGFVLGPEFADVTYQAIHLLPLSAGKGLLVIATDIGFVESCIIEVPVMNREEMAYVAGMLNRHLTGINLDGVGDRAHRLLHEEASRYAEIIDQVVDFLRSMVSDAGEERLYVGGAVNLLRQPEFQDIDRARELLLAIEREGVIQSILDSQSHAQDSGIAIGAENRLDSVADVSVVYATFQVGKSEGKIGLLGPKRMDYARAVAIVRDFERRLSRFFSQDN